MRDLLNDLSEGLSHPDPIRRAQIQMKKPLPKRFYQTVSVEPVEEGFAITLDGKAVRTPARQVLALPNEALAKLVAAEWEAQVEVLQTVAMVLSEMAISGQLVDAREIKTATGGLIAQQLTGVRLSSGMAKAVAVLHQPQLVITHGLSPDIQADRYVPDLSQRGM